MKNLNKMKIAPDMQYEIGQDKVGYFPEWSVKDDETLRKKVENLARSTFDKSKFTVVGSPTITENGIASGFSDSNYLTKSAILPTTTGHTFIFEGEAKLTATPNVTQYVFSAPLSTSSNNRFIALAFRNTGKIAVLTPSASTLVETSIEYAVNTSYKYKIVTDLTSFLDVYINGENVLTHPVSETGVSFNGDVYLGVYSSNLSSYAFTAGQIDLKQFSITVDGVPVFSGNKTGIDTIKPDNYTVVGSPTITPDGVASGFSDSNYLTKTLSQNITIDKINIKGRFYTGSGTKSQNIVFSLSDTPGSLPGTVLQFSYLQGSRQIGLAGHNDTTWSGWYSSYNAIELNTWYYYRVYYNNGYIKLDISLDDDNYTNVINNSITVNGSYTSNKLFIGSINSVYNYCEGSIDLNAFKIYVDGNLVYQPCLKIPYTEGQNYVKVVDKLYRDRVKDLFEQKGYNGYYTIGEDDFTLPSNKWSDVIEHKENGLTVAEQRVDQTLTIRGACEQGVDVNLPMEFFSADSYAVFGVGTTGTNTASKFTPAADGNYIAIGKGKV